jgi:hypothetical protein
VWVRNALQRTPPKRIASSKAGVYVAPKQAIAAPPLSFAYAATGCSFI